jgi:adenosylmethionine-8-amino-7-oxononanoate aminotransferase
MDDDTRMWNPFANMGRLAGHQLVIARGQGSTVFDQAGTPYLDATGSLWYCNVGHGRAEVADAAAAQMRQLAAYNTFEFYSNPPAEALARRIADLAPMPGAKVFFTSGGGSDAIDTAGKLARAYWAAVGRPNKRVMIARSLAYHGMNAYGTSLGGIPANVQPFLPLVTLVEHVEWNDPAALAGAIDRLGADNVAAFFAEPVVGAGGVLFPPEGYLTEVRRICDERDVLLVSDEVVTGFGRTGEWFGAQRYGIRPDLMTVAKGLTSGYAPLGAVVAGARVAEPFWAPGTEEVFRHGYTYSGHPTACAVALANLDILEREDLVARVRAMEAPVAAALKPLGDHPLVAQVRTGAGLLAAVEVREQARTDDPTLLGRLVAAVRDAGVITRGLRGAALQFSPPFVITEAEIERVAAAFAAGLDAVVA